MSKTSQYQEKREQLRTLSRSVKAMMESGQLDAATVNEGLIELYKMDGHSEFKTFKQWKDAGFSITKGSKAFLVWGSPREITHPDPEQNDDEFKYFPLCYLFSDMQVEKMKEGRLQHEMQEA